MRNRLLSLASMFLGVIPLFGGLLAFIFGADLLGFFLVALGLVERIILGSILYQVSLQAAKQAEALMTELGSLFGDLQQEQKLEK